jgi:nitroreductase
MNPSADLDNAIVPILEAALRAPSSHNTQPWRFRVDDGTVHLYADRTRGLAVNDPHDRELAISCGCALLHLRVAAAANGLTALVRLLPDPADDDLLATVSFAPAGDSPDPDASLAQHIDHRHTYRKRFEPRQIPESVLDGLIEAAQSEGATLYLLSTEDLRHQVAELIAEGDAAHWANPSWRRELASWMHPEREGDGITIPWLTGPLTQFAVRTFDMGDGEGAKDRQIADESPVLAVLYTADDTQLEWVKAGQALGRVLLQACGHHVQASFLNQPVQLPQLRPQLHELLGQLGFAQMVIRFGYVDGRLPVTPRRQLHEVMAPHARRRR